MRKLIPIILMFVFAAFSVSAADIKKWVDKEGNTHYGDQPPVGITPKQVHIDSVPTGKNSRPAEEESIQPPIGYVPSGSYSVPSEAVTPKGIPIYYIPSGRSKDNNGLRPGEMSRLRAAESLNRQRQINKNRAVQTRENEQAATRERCRGLQDYYGDLRGRKRGHVVTEIRNSGC